VYQGSFSDASTPPNSYARPSLEEAFSNKALLALIPAIGGLETPLLYCPRFIEEESMEVTTYEAVVEGGQVRLPEDVHLPDHTKVYVVVPCEATVERVTIISPRLVHPEQLAEFAKEVTEDRDDASL